MFLQIPDGKADSLEKQKRSEGFILLSVLSVVAVLSALILATTMSVRSDVAHIGVERRLVRAGAIADAGLMRIVTALKVNDEALISRLLDRARPVRWQFAGQEALLTLVPETGKVDLNSGDPDLLVRVLRAVVRKDELTDKLVQRLDDQRRKGQELETVRGLLDPADRTGPLAQELEAVFTVWTGIPGINPRFAPDIVLRNLPGLQEDEIDRLIHATRRGSEADLSPFIFRLGRVLQADRPIYRARSQVAIEGVTARREILFVYNSTTKSALIVFWRDVVN